MKLNSVIQFVLLASISFAACGPDHRSGAENNVGGEKKHAALSYPSDRVPEYRKKIKSQAIAEYREKVDDPLNDWYFYVSVYETPKTFHFLLKLQFEELRGEDTLILPNFGIEPSPVLVKGKDKYSCLIGFKDKKDSIREYKLVTVKEGRELKLSTLHHYAVDTYLTEQ